MLIGLTPKATTDDFGCEAAREIGISLIVSGRQSDMTRHCGRGRMRQSIMRQVICGVGVANLAITVLLAFSSVSLAETVRFQADLQDSNEVPPNHAGRAPP